MDENISRALAARKPAVKAAGGVVAAQNQRAADIGARVLADGGNAIDAAVATAFALGVIEPWMSGVGGGGFMVVHRAGQGTKVVDYGMIAARGLDPATYPLSGKQSGDLFGWPGVIEDRNLTGYHAIAVPGQVDGMATALKQFGTWSWDRILAPAIELAEQGLMVDWYATLLIASSARSLAKFESSRAAFLPGGLPPVTEWAGGITRVKLPNLAQTLARLAKAGARDYYEGEIAAKLVADLKAGGSPISAEDLRGYHARVVEPLVFDYGAAKLFAPGGLTAGPTYQRVLSSLAGKIHGPAPTPDSMVAFVQALSDAYAERLANMGDKESCTTNLCVADRHGNMVALTQTLLSAFGSKVLLPQTGVLMNNGIYWFDPRPGQPNSMAPGKRPLSNICPVFAMRDGKPWFALGGSGGRRIMPAVAQITSFLVDHGMDMDRAFHQPRVDYSGAPPVLVNAHLDAAIQAALAARFKTQAVPFSAYPMFFACPSGVMRLADGASVGAIEPSQAWASASGA